MIGVYLLCMIVSLTWLVRGEKKYKEMILFVLAGSVLAAFVWIWSSTEKDRSEEFTVIRNSREEGPGIVEMTAEAGGETGNLRIEVYPKNYTQDELKELFYRMLPKLDQKILGINESFDRVSENLCFAKSLKGFPFQIRWETSRPDIIDYEGKISSEVPDTGVTVEITARISEDKSGFCEHYLFYARVYPRESPFFERLAESVRELEFRYREEESFRLPAAFEGKDIRWSEKREDKSVLLFLLFCTAGIAVVLGKKKEQEKKEEKRNRRLEREYPEIVCKIALYIGAGMTVQGAFRKVTQDYKKRRKQGWIHPAYEEILIACGEIDSGIPETKAYINMGKRCRLQSYIRFTAMLSQYVKKGNSGIREALKEETNTALEERKASAKRLGEEAGTKLLLPMAIMLVIVMIVIIIPAFSAFSL